MKICPSCGTQAEDGTFFCPNCQADLPASSVVTPPGEPYDPSAPAQFGEPGASEYPPASPAPQAPLGAPVQQPGYAPAPPPGGYAGSPQYPGQAPYPGQEQYPGQQPAYPGGYGYQPPPVDADGVPFGSTKFAWGALFFGWIWCAVYGLWAYLAIDLGISAVSAVLTAFPDENNVATALGGVVGMVSLGWRIYLGFLGPKTFWKQYPNRYTVERWNRHQRNWGIAAIIYLAVTCLCIAAIIALIGAGVGAYLSSVQ